ncbi:MAG: M48 family metallopeptidase [Patescibacteria group bacterium]
MPTLYTQADKNIRKTWLLMSLFFIFIIFLGYIFSYAMDSYGILVIAVIFSILTSFVSYWWSDKIVLWQMGAHEVTRENNKEIYRLVENLCITAGLPVPKIYIIDDPALNAFATGRDPQHAVIALTSGIIQKLERVELEGVIAHELSHIGNRDMLLSTAVVVLVGFVILLSDWFRRWTWFGGFGRRRSRDADQFGMIILFLSLIFSLLAPIIAILIQLAISRKREFLADASGALLTRFPDGLARALQKISSDPTPFRKASTATAHLFIVNPFKGKGLSKLFSTHPPVEERIKALTEMDVK